MSQQGPGGLSEKDDRELAAMKGASKGWRYSMAVGVMYGNIPVGLIVVAIGVIIWLVVR